MAFGHRDHAFEMSINFALEGPLSGGRERGMEARRLERGQPQASPTVYANHLSVDDAGRVSSADSEEKLTWLKALTRTWEPENLFRLNHKIPPG